MQRDVSIARTVAVAAANASKSVVYRGASSLASSSSSSSPTLNHTNDYRILRHHLQAFKSLGNSRTVVAAHGRVVRLEYETFPSLVALLISNYVHCDCLSYAHRVIDQISYGRVGLLVLNIIIKDLMEQSECEIAKKLFSRMPVRDVVTWNSVIGGCVKNSRFEDALRFFRVMVRSDVEPDKFTFASVLTGCARLGSLNSAQLVHQLLIEKKIKVNSVLSTALIDMYSKCGRIQTAKEIFDSVERRDISVWNSMINGLAMHGLVFDAIATFSRMEVENVIPDSITFLGILTACSHSGLVEEGKAYFDLMRSRYSIHAQLEHYGVLVDLLSRNGLLEEAYEVIKAMPMKPDVVVWRSLLSACRTYKRPELGELAIGEISRLKSGDYVLLSNVYCSQNRWDSAQGVREMMRKHGIRKIRGKSWFEWLGVIHQFKSGDKAHPETESIFRVLDGLIQLTKLHGFVPTTELVIMDVSEEEKEENLYYHSEKLALAYGVLKTSPGVEIRISKNLRICYDCHNWIKLVSRLLKRVIIVRDRVRFHQFEDGSCSCGDYW